MGGRDGIAGMNRIVHPDDAGVAFRDFPVKPVPPLRQGLFGRRAGLVDGDHPLFALVRIKIVIN